MERTSMSMRELKRIELPARVKVGTLKVKDAAVLLGVCDRQGEAPVAVGPRPGLWKWQRRGRSQTERPPRLGNLAKSARFPHSHKPLLAISSGDISLEGRKGTFLSSVDNRPRRACARPGTQAK
jgi:hypothetical protein